MGLALRRSSVVADRRAATTAPDRAPTTTGTDDVGAAALTLVPARRRAAGFLVTLSVLVTAIMLGAAVLHTQLAERQLHIDRLDRSVTEAQDRFDVLRRQRAELRAPNRLATEARRLGMVPASVTEFVEIDPADIAASIAATGRPSVDAARLDRREPLDQFLLVKRVSNEEP